MPGSPTTSFAQLSTSELLQCSKIPTFKSHINKPYAFINIWGTQHFVERWGQWSTILSLNSSIIFSHLMVTPLHSALSSTVPSLFQWPSKVQAGYFSQKQIWWGYWAAYRPRMVFITYSISSKWLLVWKPGFFSATLVLALLLSSVCLPEP